MEHDRCFQRGLWAPCLVLARRVYNVRTVSTISRLRPLVAHGLYTLFTAFVWCTGKRQSGTVVSKEAFGPLP